MDLQEIDEESYLSTKRGFIPLDDSCRWLPTLENASSKMSLPIKLFSSYHSFFESFNLSVVLM
ncbi:MAG: hypothetical protein ACOCTT_03345, partial [archaeon]